MSERNKKNSPKFSRIEFFKLSGVALGAGAMLILSRRQAQTGSVYPPGALPAGEFEAACLRCSRCVEICDQDAIEMGLDGLPRISGLKGYCDFCLDCIDVCPTTALSPIVVEQPIIGVVKIDRDRCIAWNWPGCRLCYEHCTETYQAIYLDEEFRPIVDEGQCVGCGACVQICPQSAQANKPKKYAKAIQLFPVEM